MEKKVVFIALFAALIAALGLLPKFDLISGVPITAQSLGVMLCGTILGARNGFLAALLFVGLVAIGLPLLSGGRGGLGVFASPTVGFIIGFPFAAFVTGFVMERLRDLRVSFAATTAAICGGVVVLYIFGIIGLSVMLDKTILESIPLVAAFIPGDVVKAILAGIITHGIWSARPEYVLSRA
jgi:biotin transport system substrate-specific component